MANKRTTEFRGEGVTETLRLCPDGVYRWVYKLSMLKNPVIVIAMNKLREIMREAPEVLDNARLTADGKHLYLIKNKLTNLRD